MTYDEAKAWMEKEKLRPFMTPVTNQWNWSNLKFHNFKEEDLEMAQFLHQELVIKNKKMQYSWPSLEAAEEEMRQVLMRFRPKKGTKR